MAWALIEGGLVTNIGAHSPGRIECGPEVVLGWSHDGEIFRPPPVDTSSARRVDMVLTDIQFAQVCMIAGILTAAEAEGWVASGQIPALALAAIASLPVEQQPFARIRFAGARTILRLDPFLALLQGTLAALGNPISDAQLDAMFEQGAAL